MENHSYQIAEIIVKIEDQAPLTEAEQILFDNWISDPENKDLFLSMTTPPTHDELNEMA